MILAIWTIGIMCLAVIIAGLFSKRFRDFVSTYTPTLSFAAALAALTVFVQIHLTVDQYSRNQAAVKTAEKQRFDARMATLVAEVWGNLQVCDHIINGEEKAIRAEVIPQNRFQYDMLQDLFRTGELTKHTVRGSLFSVYHRFHCCPR